VSGRQRGLPARSGESARLVAVGPESEVRQDILRLAATTGVAAQAVEVSGLSEASWTGPSLVVIDAASADEVSAAGLSRRPGVLIVTTSRPDPALWSAAVAIGVEQVLELPAGQAWLIDRFADLASSPDSLGTLLAVIGGHGGAGASTLAAALALSAARSGRQPVLLGADPWDGGIDIALGAEDVPGPRWPDLAGISGRLSTAAILEGLPRAHGVRFVSAARAHASPVPLAALAAVVTAGRRTGGPVVVDLPRGGGESARWLGGVADLALVVCAATVSGALASRSLVADVGWNPAGAGIVVRTGLGRDVDDDALRAAVGLPVILRISEDSQLRRQRQRGEPPGPRSRSRIARSCAAVWRLADGRQMQPE